MNFIKDKKIHRAIVIPVLFLALGYSSFYSVRGTLASLAVSGMTGLNDIIAFLMSAITAGLIYELVTALVFRMLGAKLGVARVHDLQYALRFFMIPAGILSGAIKTLYFFFPFIFAFGEIFIEPLCNLIFFIFYLIFSCKAYFRKEEYAGALMSVGSSFLCLYAFIAVVSLFAGVAV